MRSPQHPKAETGPWRALLRRASLRRSFVRGSRCDFLEPRRLFAAGDPDFGFGTYGAGETSLAFDGIDLLINDTAIAPDGKVLLGGNKGNNMAVVRLNVDGSLDTTFGEGGLFESARKLTVSSIAVQSDLNIVVGFGLNEVYGAPDMEAGRLLQSGLGFDPSFGNNGIASVGDRWEYESSVRDVLVQRDGKVVVAGGADQDFVVVRYNANGTPDNTFEGDGVAKHGFGAVEEASAIAIDYNGNFETNPGYGSLAVVGINTFRTVTPDRFLVLRLRADGTTDNTFDGDGKLTAPNISGAGIEAAFGVAIQPGGKVVAAGSAIAATDPEQSNFLIARFNLNGTLDNSFGLSGSGGVTELDLGGRDRGRSLAIGYHNTVGNLLVGGSRNNSVSVVALTPDGQPDTRFSGDGILNTGTPGNGAGLAVTGNLIAPVRKLVITGGSKYVQRRIDVGSVITMGSFDTQMTETGPTTSSFYIARSVTLPFAERIFLGYSGGATKPVTSPPRPADFTGTGITFGNGLTSTTYVDIPLPQAGETGTFFASVILTAVNDTLIEGDEFGTFTILPNVAYDIVTPSSTTLVVRDNDVVGGPSVLSSSFLYETAQEVQFRFSRDVAASLTDSDFIFTGPSGMPAHTFAYDASLNTATLTFSGLLPDGNYTATAKASGISSAEGPMTADHVLSFFFKNADANRDRAVNFSDLVVLAQNYGLLGRTFSQGNFDYSAGGAVGFQDLVLLAQRYNTTLAPVTAGISAAPPKRRTAVSVELLA